MPIKSIGYMRPCIIIYHVNLLKMYHQGWQFCDMNDGLYQDRDCINYGHQTKLSPQTETKDLRMHSQFIWLDDKRPSFIVILIIQHVFQFIFAFIRYMWIPHKGSIEKYIYNLYNKNKCQDISQCTILDPFIKANLLYRDNRVTKNSSERVFEKTLW